MQTYFNKEIQSFLFGNSQIQYESEYDKKRDIGENEEILCQIIRNDLIDDLTTYVSQNEISLNSIINLSVFETNIFLIDKNLTLIEYSAFFGSIQIFEFKHLFLNGIKLIIPSLWIYAIHGMNQEIINILEENNSFLKCIKEAIKCHHTEIVK